MRGAEPRRFRVTRFVGQRGAGPSFERGGRGRPAPRSGSDNRSGDSRGTRSSDQRRAGSFRPAAAGDRRRTGAPSGDSHGTAAGPRVRRRGPLGWTPRRTRSGGRGRPEARRGRRAPESLEEAGSPRAPRTTGGRGRTDGRGGSGGRGRPDSNKRTSKSSDDRSPTRSGIQYPSPRYRRRDGEVGAGTRTGASVAAQGAARPRSGRDRRRQGPSARARHRRHSGARLRSTEASEELRQIAGRGANRAVAELARAAEAVNAGHERDAARILRPLRDAYPDAAAVRELLGLVHYRLGQYPAAAKELGAFADLTGSVEQHPVLMDCARAQKKYAKVASLWEELAASSPSAALVSEGRIVMAGSLADRGRLRDAVAMLERRGAQRAAPVRASPSGLVRAGGSLRAHRRPSPRP